MRERERARSVRTSLKGGVLWWTLGCWGGGGGLWRVEDEEVEGGEYHGEGGLRFHFGCRYDELMIGGCCFVGATVHGADFN